MYKLVILFLLITNQSFSQDTFMKGIIRNDSLFFRNERDALMYMNHKMKRFKKDHQLGTISFFSGIGLLSSTAIMKKQYVNPVAIIGTGLSVFGGLLMIFSHGHIARAGDWYFEPTSVTLKF